MAARPSSPPVSDDAADQPEVRALRKKIRGEALTEEERVCLEATYHRPAWADGPTFSQAQITALLEARRRLGA